MQSCVNSTYTGFQINEEKEIIGKPLHVVDSIPLRYPFRIRQQDSTFYVLDLHGREFYCSRLSYPDVTLKKMIAPKGNGPEDFLSVENIRLNNSGTIYLLDANKERIGLDVNNEQQIIEFRL